MKKCNGSANSIEEECAQRIWQRLEGNFKFRYTTVLSEGDGKTCGTLGNTTVYGDSIDLRKEESTNHVTKRMGTALNNLISLCNASKIVYIWQRKLTKRK